MRIVGIDLASAPAKTGVCVLEVADGRARPTSIAVGADDDALTACIEGADRVGIDAPFGWPDAFRALLEEVPKAPVAWGPELRDTYRFRRSDRAVRAVTRRWPLSVSSDLLAVPAFRCRLLLARWGVDAFDGSGFAVEVYPAGALAAWGLGSKGYKGRDGAERRAALLASLREAAPWLDVTDAQAAEARADDDAFDALVAALAALAAHLGRVREIPEGDREAARREGWVVLPAGLLEDLGRDLAAHP